MSTEDQNTKGDEKKNGPLRDFMQKLEQGARGLSGAKQSRNDESDPPLSETPVELAPEAQGQNGQHQAEHVDDEPLLIDTQAETPDTRSKAKPGISRKHGLIIVGVLVVAGLIYKPAPKSPATTTPAAEASAPEQSGAGLAIPSSEELPIPAGVEGNSFGNEVGSINPIGATLEELDLAGPLNVPKKDSIQMPTPPVEGSPFGFPQQPASEPTTGNPGLQAGPSLSATDSPFGDLPNQPASQAIGQPAPTGLPTSFAPPEAQAGQSNSKSVAGKDDAILAGEPEKNPDSEQQPNLQAETADEMSEMRAKLALQDQKIMDLQKELDAKSKAPSQQSKASSNSTPSTVKPRSYASTQVKPKVGPRPKICVKAVAPPARNCSTCVAHAFVVDTNREDTMVGQGDYIAGFRVAITGDRIDLQNSAGEVVHKFWSQPNGCPSI